MKWTTKQRASALKITPCSISLRHQIDAGHPNASIVEAAVHEIAHAVVLGSWYERRRADFGDRIDAAINRRWQSHDNTRGWMWQEILACAVEVLVLKRLRLPYHAEIVYGNPELDTHYSGPAFCNLVHRATKTKTTRRRARRAMALLNQLCEEGLHAQGKAA